MPVGQAFDLGTVWNADRLDEDWQPKTLDDARQAFAAVGLTAPFWTS